MNIHVRAKYSSLRVGLRICKEQKRDITLETTNKLLTRIKIEISSRQIFLQHSLGYGCYRFQLNICWNQGSSYCQALLSLHNRENGEEEEVQENERDDALVEKIILSNNILRFKNISSFHYTHKI